MFIVTAKLSKKKALLIVLAIAVTISALIFLTGQRDRHNENPQAAPTREVHTEQDIAAYLETLGWQVAPSPLEVQEILIPREFDHVFEAYNHMQIQAGFDLSNYQGLPALRYTYEIKNHPDQSEGVVADVLIVNNQIVGGDIQSLLQDGFIHGLIPKEGA